MEFITERNHNFFILFSHYWKHLYTHTVNHKSTYNGLIGGIVRAIRERLSSDKCNYSEISTVK